MELNSKNFMLDVYNQSVISKKIYQQIYKIFLFLFVCLRALDVEACPSLKEAIQDIDVKFCVDGGGSKTTVHAVNSQGEIVTFEHQGQKTSCVSSGPTNINAVGLENVEKNLRALFEGLKIGQEGTPLSDIAGRSAVVCGIAGFASNTELQPKIRELFLSYGFSNNRIALFSDVDLAKHLIENEGAILIAGTGSICFSNSSGKEKRVGGHGYLFGDKGSGWYIGKLAVNEAFKAECNGENFSLTQKMLTSTSEALAAQRKSKKTPEAQETCTPSREDFPKEILSARELLIKTSQREIPISTIAALTPLVFDAAYAEEKDEVCLNIINKAAGHLAKHINIAVEGATRSDFPVYLIGGVFKNKNGGNFIRKIQEKVDYIPGINFINIANKPIVVEVVTTLKNKG